LRPQRQAPPALQVSAGRPQAVQLPPPTPQALGRLPAWQLPLWQQPPLQAVRLALPHDEVQVWLLVLHAWPVGQSEATLQPQVVPERHRWPLGWLVQSTQARPLPPQLPAALPPLQVPPAQQPPLHAWEPLQLEVQVLAASWHACSELQSAVPLHPQVPPVGLPTHTWPSLETLQGAQTPPSLPQAEAAKPVTHTPASASVQQPFLHGWLALQALVHWWVLTSQAVLSGQSEVVAQPQVPATQAWPAGALEQSRQVLPAAPQAATAVPEPHTPPWQQPPLHSWAGLQEVVQRCCDWLQAAPVAHSLVSLQPQLPPVPVPRHTVPSGLPRHESQVPPSSPQAAWAVPAAQVPPLQQPWLHSCDALQAVVHLWAPVSQASPAGQSEVTLQPHTLARHWCPSLEVEQSRHRLPAAPQAPTAVPEAHTPFEQQAPLQGCSPLQPVVQAWAPVSHDAPDEQSPPLLQPQEPPVAPEMQAEPTPLPAQF
jgi:hypothetical protein